MQITTNKASLSAPSMRVENWNRRRPGGGGGGESKDTGPSHLEMATGLNFALQHEQHFKKELVKRELRTQKQKSPQPQGN